jgi:hypothetical protein
VWAHRSRYGAWTMPRSSVPSTRVPFQVLAAGRVMALSAFHGAVFSPAQYAR